MPAQLLTPDSALAEIGSWDLQDESESSSGSRAAAASAWATFLRQQGEAALFKGIGSEHITSSAFVFSPDFSRILLTYHRRLHRWVQLGGHVDREDASLVAAGTREALEESGLADIELLDSTPLDFDRHELHGNFTCHAHWDIGFAFVADPDVHLLVSEESLDVAWWPVGGLPNDPDVILPDGSVREGQGVCAANFPRRLASVLAHPLMSR
ncbi:NUDIX domain-containing protein [Actinomycetaceae bacterium L2_0104]